MTVRFYWLKGSGKFKTTSVWSRSGPNLRKWRPQASEGHTEIWRQISRKRWLLSSLSYCREWQMAKIELWKQSMQSLLICGHEKSKVPLVIAPGTPDHLLIHSFIQLLDICCTLTGISQVFSTHLISAVLLFIYSLQQYYKAGAITVLILEMVEAKEAEVGYSLSMAALTNHCELRVLNNANLGLGI